MTRRFAFLLLIAVLLGVYLNNADAIKRKLAAARGALSSRPQGPTPPTTPNATPGRR